MAYIHTNYIHTPLRKAKDEIKCEKQGGIYMEKNQPVKKIRAGAISVTIWNNPATNKFGEHIGEEGNYKTISVDRSYKDKQGQWQKTNSYRVNDLPRAMVALRKAYEYLILHEDEQHALSG